jgi:hypothetical protein
MAPEGEVGRSGSVRRPLVYRAIETLTPGWARAPAGTVPSRSGPRRTVLEATPNGKRPSRAGCASPSPTCATPARCSCSSCSSSRRRDGDLEPLLSAQRAHFSKLGERSSARPTRPRLRSRAAALAPGEHGGRDPFVETMLGETGPGAPRLQA